MAYALAKGVLRLLAALAIWCCVLTGRAVEVAAWAGGLEDHLAGAWSVDLAAALTSAMEPAHLGLAALAFTLGAIEPVVEAWALYRGRWWGPWLVVAAISCLIPFEVTALLRRLSLGRLLIFAVNLAVVAYLGRRALHRRAASAGPGHRTDLVK